MEIVNLKKVSDLIQNYLNSAILSNKSLNAKFILLKVWEKIFGNLSSSVEFFDIKDEKILILNVKNSSILYNIKMNQENLIKSIKELTGLQIDEIKVLIK